ncbi:MAG TPA: zf-HC2 domain-containing protein [Candidatus Binatia bacterium]|nr:zf-HC2 domain-containing protein [Candidatus Binatia bacterium]
MNQTHPTPEELVEYLHGELPPPQDAAVHAHLAECSPCARAYEAETSLRELVRAHARSEDRELPYRVVAAIRDAAAERTSPPAWESIRSALRPAILIPAAAALAVALYFGVSGRHSGEATPINAAYYVNNHAALTATTPFSEDAPMPAMLTSDDQTR